MHHSTADLFPSTSPMPAGFDYHPNLIDLAEEVALVDEIATLDFAPYEFRGVEARRRVVAFGFQHDYRTRRLQEASEIPPFLQSLRAKAAAYAKVPVERFVQVLVSEYTPGTPIGWHRDREHYDIVVGVSLVSAAPLRFRRRVDDRWQRCSQIVEPRSAYILAGSARDTWQHSIPAVDSLRYSVTFRTMRASGH